MREFLAQERVYVKVIRPYIRIRRGTQVPIYQQITEQFIGAIRRREWKHGQSLPGVRSLASDLGVSLETVQRAYHRLQQGGWVESKPRLGTVVAAKIVSAPIALPKPEAERHARVMQELRRWSEVEGVIPVSGGTRPLSDEWLKQLQQFAAEAVRRATTEESFDPFGLPALRSRLQGWLGIYGSYVETDRLCLTAGTQQGLQLVAAQEIEPGSVVFVPEMCYLAAQEVFRDAGAQVRTLPMSPGGISLEPLAQSLASGVRVSLVYVMVNGHYPTGWSCTGEQRQTLLSLAGRHGFAVVEDDYFAGFYFGSRPPQTLLSTADADVRLYYLCSFSNITHTSLRLGLLVCPPDCVDQVERKKYLADTHTSTVLQYMLLELFESAGVERRLTERRAAYRVTRDAAMQSVRKWLPGVGNVVLPECGLNLWIETQQPLGLAFLRNCLAERVLAMPDEAFTLSAGRNGFQVNFATVGPDVLDEGIRRIAQVLARMPQRLW